MTRHFTPSVKTVVYSKCHAQDFRSQLLPIFCRFLWKRNHPPGGRGCLSIVGVWVSAGTQLPGVTAAQHLTVIGRVASMRCSASAIVAPCATLLGFLFNTWAGWPLWKVVENFVILPQDFCFAFLSFYIPMGVCITFLQVGHEDSGSFFLGKRIISLPWTRQETIS